VASNIDATGGRRSHRHFRHGAQARTGDWLWSQR
jgi:hypothetical protein